MKPKIGITPQYDHLMGVNKISPFYAKAVEDSGGIPFILPFTQDADITDYYTKFLDGIIFSGGTNVDPRRYGEKEQSNCGPVEHERDAFEIELCQKATEKDIPVLGICRGCQLMTVAAGGSLIQHLEEHIQNTDKHTVSHAVSITENTLLHQLLNTESIMVNSFHHQAVKNTGALKLAATDEKGVIEAVYMQGKKFHLGVQWHPERMYRFNVHAKLIFDSFISSCSVTS